MESSAFSAPPQVFPTAGGYNELAEQALNWPTPNYTMLNGDNNSVGSFAHDINADAPTAVSPSLFLDPPVATLAHVHGFGQIAALDFSELSNPVVEELKRNEREEEQLQRRLEVLNQDSIFSTEDHEKQQKSFAADVEKPFRKKEADFREEEKTFLAEQEKHQNVLKRKAGVLQEQQSALQTLQKGLKVCRKRHTSLLEQEKVVDARNVTLHAKALQIKQMMDAQAADRAEQERENKECISRLAHAKQEAS